MPYDKQPAVQRLAAWLEDLEKFNLPDWDSLPQLDLYMDQVILLLNRYLSPLERFGDEKAVTASIINNYVRMKVVPPPVKKRYSRVHLAYLIIICTLKQSLSISCIQRLLPVEHTEEAARALYTSFVAQYRASVTFIRSISPEEGRLAIGGVGSLPMADGGSFAATSAILTTLSKFLTEYLLQEGPSEADDDENDDD